MEDQQNWDQVHRAVHAHDSTTPPGELFALGFGIGFLGQEILNERRARKAAEAGVPVVVAPPQPLGRSVSTAIIVGLVRIFLFFVVGTILLMTLGYLLGPQGN